MVKVFIVLWLAIFTGVLMALQGPERVTLTTPVFSQAGVTNFRPCGLDLKRAVGLAQAEIRATFCEINGGFEFVTNGRRLTCAYSDPDATTLIGQLNVANLTVKSLERRVLERCQADGKLGAGTISGTPQ